MEQEKSRECRHGYARERRHRRGGNLLVGGSFHLDGPHGVGAGQIKRISSRGGKWFSLMDKVIRPATLESGVAQGCPERGGGRGGWAEHGAVLAPSGTVSDGTPGPAWRTAAHWPAPVRRVEIPKGDR